MRSEHGLRCGRALPEALEVRKANATVPVVIAPCPGMISNGFATTLDHPRGQMTGMLVAP